MRFITILGLLFMLASTGESQTNNTNPNYDATLAEKLGADDYGMKSYVLVILRTGSNTDPDEEAKNQAFRGHFDNMDKMAEEGKLIVAGPIGKNENEYRGIFILNIADLEEARALVQTDPAIAAKYLTADLYNWYGSAALPEYLEASDKIWKISP